MNADQVGVLATLNFLLLMVCTIGYAVVIWLLCERPYAALRLLEVEVKRLRKFNEELQECNTKLLNRARLAEGNLQAARTYGITGGQSRHSGPPSGHAPS